MTLVRAVLLWKGPAEGGSERPVPGSGRSPAGGAGHSGRGGAQLEGQSLGSGSHMVFLRISEWMRATPLTA